MGVAGTYECVFETPMGKKSGRSIVVPTANGESFTGTLSNALLGTVEITRHHRRRHAALPDNVTSPMRMTIDCEVIVDGDTLNGFVTAGMFGELELSGRRISGRGPDAARRQCEPM